MHPDYEIFNRNWSLYQKLISADCMHHRSIGTAIARVFDAFQGIPASVVDLGCGDAQEIARQARHYPIQSFTGLDLSAMALNIAEKNLDFADKVFLRCAPMESIADFESDTVDFVFSGYAIHHLADDSKKELLHQAHRILRPGGHFLMADVFRKQGRTRPDYISAYVNMVRTEWMHLTGPEQKSVIEHLEAFDFPADCDELQLWMAAAGFEVLSMRMNDDFHGIIHLRKVISSGRL